MNMVTSAMSRHIIPNSAARFTGLLVWKRSPILCIGISVYRAMKLAAYRNNWLFRYMDRQISSYINSVQPLAAPVMICFANQEGKAVVASRKRSEQAEVGQSPTLLALRFATGVLRILRGYF